MKDRLLHFDLLRVAAIALVMVIHVSSRDFDLAPVDSFQWQVLNIYNGFARICVPVLFMLSGTFLLDPEKAFSIRTFFSRNVLRIVNAFLFWSAVYAVITNVLVHGSDDPAILNIIWETFTSGYFHLWFLFRIFEVYLMTPFLRKIAEDKKVIEYFMLFCLVVGFLIPTFSGFPVGSTVTFAGGEINLDITIGYAGYYFVGYYLFKYQISEKLKKIIYILGTAGAFTTIAGTSFLSLQRGGLDAFFYNYLTPNVLMTSLAVFLFFKDNGAKWSFLDKGKAFILEFSRYSFGMYLVHALVMFFLTRAGLNVELLNPILSVPLLTSLVFVISYLVIKVLAKTPVIKNVIL